MKIFICGIPRSGTTMLQYQLALNFGHPLMPECNPISNVVNSFVKTRSFDSERFECFYETEEKRDKLYQVFLREHYQNIGSIKGKAMVCFKDPYLIFSHPAIVKLDETAKVVITCRNPVRVVGSLKEVARRSGGNFCVKSAIDSVLPFYDRLNRCNKSPAHTIVVPYEFLTEQWAGASKVLGEFIGFRLRSRRVSGNVSKSVFSTSLTDKEVSKNTNPCSLDDAEIDAVVEGLSACYGDTLEKLHASYTKQFPGIAKFISDRLLTDAIDR